MKWLQTLLVIGTMLCVFIFTGYRSVEMKAENKLEQMLAVVKKEGGNVQNFTWLAKGEVSSVHDIDSFHTFIRTLQERIDVQDWHVEKVELGYQATAIKNEANYNERVVVTWTNYNTAPKTFVMYEAKGLEWNEKILKTMNKIFSQKPTIYTCVQAVLSDKIEGVLLNKANKILERFEATPIESLQERAFVTVSAYTGKWNDALSVNKKKMNVQVALRNADDKTTVVIGTPIITSEY